MATDADIRYPMRTARAARTRAAIVAAAGELFADRGYAATTMKAIGERADVSVESVYLVGSKASLLAAALSIAFAGDEDERPIGEHDDYAAAFALPDLGAVLDRYTELVTASIARSDALWKTARAAADTDPAIRDLVSNILATRRSDIAAFGPWLEAHTATLPADLDTLIASVSMLVSHECYEHFIDQYGWSQARFQSWLRHALGRLLFSNLSGRLEGTTP